MDHSDPPAIHQIQPAQERTIEEIKAEAQERAERGAYPLIGLDPADVHEALTTVKTRDRDEWAAAWSAVADRYYWAAERSTSVDERRSNYLRAWRLYYFAQWPVPSSAGKRAAYAKALDAFARSAQACVPPLEVVRIPFEGKEIVGYLRLPSAAAKTVPVVLAVSGLDSRKKTWRRHTAGCSSTGSAFSPWTDRAPDSRLSGPVLPPTGFFPERSITSLAGCRKSRRGGAMTKRFQLTVNERRAEVQCEDDAPLLYVLRNDLSLNGPKFGCGLGQCGACTVLMDGVPTRSCVTPVAAVGEAKIVTLDGLAVGGKAHPLQVAFLEAQAAQCGYCTNGMIMTAKALLDRNSKPDAAAIKEALSANLCRCGIHNRIVRAVQLAARDTAR